MWAYFCEKSNELIFIEKSKKQKLDMPPDVVRKTSSELHLPQLRAESLLDVGRVEASREEELNPFEGVLRPDRVRRAVTRELCRSCVRVT